VSASRRPLSVESPWSFSGVVPGAVARPSRGPARFWGVRLVVLTIGAWLVSLVMGFQVGLIVLTLVGLTGAVVGLWKPALGVLGITMLCTLDAVSRIYLMSGGLLRWNTFNYWLALVMLLQIGWLLRLKDSQIRLLLVFIAFLTVELVFSQDLMDGAQHILNLATIFGLLIYFRRASSDPDVWYWSTIVSGVMSALGGLVYFLQKSSLPIINENAWSFFPLTSVFVTCVYFTSPFRRREAGLPLVLAIIDVLWVFLSGSRGSMFSGAVCLLFILLRLRSVKMAALTLVGSGLFAVVMSGALEERSTVRLSTLFNTERSLSGRTSGRWDLAFGGWYIFRENPLGVGTGGFPDAWATLNSRRQISTFRKGKSIAAHSAWIKVLVENGVPGILLFTAFVLSFAVVGWRRRGAGMFLPGLLVTAALSVAFLADEFQGKGLWYLSAAILLLTRLAPDVGNRPGGRRRNRRPVAARFGP
jgi:O-antigen ligase